MKRIKNIYKYLLLVAVLMITVPGTSAITIDGNPSDWGQPGFLTNDWSVNDTWLPNPGIQFIVEDNRNPLFGGSYTGVHIQGIGSSYSFYNESKKNLNANFNYSLVDEPYSGESYDLEAMYFQQDNNNVYLLIITSEPPNAGGDSAPGDLRIDVDHNATSGDGYKYELGVKLENYYHTGFDPFDIISVSDWAEHPYYIPANLPARIVDGRVIGRAEGVYVRCNGCNSNTNGEDHGKPNYIIEMRIPKRALVGPGNYQFDSFSLVDNCTNDSITHIPEFPVIALPIAGILALVFVLRRRKS